MNLEQIETLLHTRFSKKIRDPFVKTIRTYTLIEPGDKIAVCISGGKDSALLAVLLRDYQRYSGIPFELICLAMDPGYEPENRQQIVSNMALPCRFKSLIPIFYKSQAGMQLITLAFCAQKCGADISIQRHKSAAVIRLHWGITMMMPLKLY